jgi:Zn-finger nucleic acid-binding protein
MRCPACREHMVVIEHEKIELDYCLRCKGTWFDATELDLMFRSLGVAQGHSVASLMKQPTRRPAEARRKCPLCRRKMDKMIIGREPEVLIDSCPRGDGLWFDGGELDELIGQLGDTTGAGGRVASFLGQTLGSGRPRT